MTDSIYRRHGKRAFDLSLAVPLLILFAPVMAVVAVAVRWRLGAPVLFCQQRPGLNAVPFRMAKFRTMTDARGPDGSLLDDAQRLTRLGRFLRSTSLDELPELWHVVRGRMSLVGPRPLLVKYLDRYSPEQSRRHAVLPGITGWAQISGRNDIAWDEKLRCDVWYVDNLSFRLDVQVLLRTVAAVLGRRGISTAGHQTAPEFLGTAAPSLRSDLLQQRAA